MQQESRLTKTIISNGQEAISCIDLGTERCLLHNGIPDCGHCPMFARMLNKLSQLEDIIEELNPEE